MTESYSADCTETSKVEVKKHTDRDGYVVTWHRTEGDLIVHSVSISMSKEAAQMTGALLTDIAGEPED